MEDDLIKKQGVKQRYQGRPWEVAGRVSETGVMDDWPLYYVSMNSVQDTAGAWAWLQIFFPLDEVNTISELEVGDLFATECIITSRGVLDNGNWRVHCWRLTVPVSQWW